jgi:hypothetical protein
MKKEYFIVFETEGLGKVGQLVPIRAKGYLTYELAEKDVEKLINSNPEYILYILPRYSRA